MYTSKPETIKANELENSKKVTRLLKDKGYPLKDDSSYLQTYRLSDFGIKKADVTKLLDELTPKVISHKSDLYKKPYRDNLRLIIYALIGSFYQFNWLALPQGDKHFHSTQRLGKLGFSRRRVEKITSLLIEEGFAVMGRKGFIDHGNAYGSKATQYFPTQKLIDFFQNVLYEFEEEMSLPNYHRFNNFPEGTTPAKEQYSEDELLLRQYNLHMSNHWWAKKGPTTRSYSKNMNRGGRLNCSFQTIVNRRLKIRASTLIDGEPIAEPDFSANHLRMCAALLGEELPTDPYKTIANITGANRDQTKAFVTMAIGCSSLGQKGGQMRKLEPNKYGLTINMYRALLDSFEKEYPWIKTEKVFYNDNGAKMQKLEGEIGLKMFQFSIEKSIPLISVHDSFAVKKSDEKETRIRMNEAWGEVIENNRLNYNI